MAESLQYVRGGNATIGGVALYANRPWTVTRFAHYGHKIITNALKELQKYSNANPNCFATTDQMQG